MKVYVTEVNLHYLKRVFVGDLRKTGVMPKFAWSKTDALHGKWHNLLITHGAEDGSVDLLEQDIDSKSIATLLAQKGYKGVYYMASCFPSSKPWEVSSYGDVKVINMMKYFNGSLICDYIHAVKVAENLWEMKIYPKRVKRG